MHFGWVIAFDEERAVTVTTEEVFEFVARDSSEEAGVSDFVAVKMQDREDSAIMDRIQELVSVPTTCERAGFCFAIADDSGDDEVGIVESCAISVG